MKNLILLPILAILSILILTECTSVDIPNLPSPDSLSFSEGSSSSGGKSSNSSGEYVFFEDFEGTASGWSIPSYTGINHWMIGSHAPYEGSKSAYITNDNWSNEYNGTATGASSIYKEVSFPNRTADFELSFHWKSYGEPNSDYMTVYLVPSSAIVTSAKPPTDYLIGKNYTSGYQGKDSWQLETITLPASHSGTYKLVFHWQNDNNISGDLNPPAAIDNIKIE